MKRMLDWIKSHRILVAFLVVLVFALPLVAVHLLFKWRSGIHWLEAEWTAGDVLGYIAGFEALLGTIILGLVSVHQNDEANEINDRLMEMQEEQWRFQIKEKAAPVDITPVVLDEERNYYVVNDDDYADEFDVVNQKYKYFFFMNAHGIVKKKAKLFNMVIEIENISDIILTEVHINRLSVYDIITNASGVSLEKANISEYNYANDCDKMARCLLKPHEKMKVCLKILMDEYQMEKESFRVNFDLSTMSIYNVIFSTNVTLFRNNVVDIVDRVYVIIDQCNFQFYFFHPAIYFGHNHRSILP